MKKMYIEGDGLKVWGLIFSIRGDSPLNEDWTPIKGISETSFVIAADMEEAVSLTASRMEDVLGMPCEEAGLHIRAFDMVESWHRLDEDHEDMHRVVDNLSQMVYRLGGSDGKDDAVMEFLDDCDERIGVKYRNRENPCMVERIDRILNKDRHDAS